MTTPGQSLPATIETLLGVGAYQIGSGGQPSGFGQNVANDFVMNLVRGAAPGIFGGITGAAGAIEALGSFLTTLPLEVLQAFQAFMPGTSLLTDFLDTATSVTTILGGILVNPMARLVSVVQQLLGILSGDVVVPLNAGVQAAKDWFTGLPGEIVSGAAAAVQGLKDLLTGIEDATDADVQAWLNAVAAVESGIQAIRDAIVNALGGLGSGHSVSDVQSFMASIPYPNVLGLLGASDVGMTIQNYLDSAVQAIYNAPTIVGNTIAGFTTALNALTNHLGFTTAGPAPAGSVSAVSLTNNEFITNTAGTQSPKRSPDPSMDTTFDFQLLYGDSMPTMTVSQGNSVWGVIGTPYGGVKESVWWIANALPGAAVSGVFINVYSVDPATDARTPVWSSVNAKDSCVTEWNHVNIPLAYYINSAQGDYYVAEMALFGTGSYTIAGIQHNAPALTTNYPQHLGGTRPSALFDAAAGIYLADGATVATHATWNQNIAATATCAVAKVAYKGGPTGVTVKCGGVSMAKVAQNIAVTGEHLEIWLLFNPPTGSSKQFEVYAVGGTTWSCSGDSATYIGPTSYDAGHVVTAQGISANTTLSMTDPGSGNSFWVGGGSSDGSTFAGDGTGTVWRSYVGDVNGTFPSGIFDCLGALNTASSATVSRSGPGSTMAVGVPLVCGAPTVTAPVYTPSIPFLGLSGSTAPAIYTPKLLTYETPGLSTHTNPAVTYPWANYFDIISCSGGAGGDAGGMSTGSAGGSNGAWRAATLTRAQMGVLDLTVQTGVGGAGGSGTYAGGNGGQASYVTVPGYGNVTAPGASGHGTAISTGYFYAWPGSVMPNETWTDHNGTDHLYYGGAGGGSPQSGGGQPGGGGAGGNAVVFPGSYVYGGPGGPGVNYILAYQ